ncbi:MAG TPA: TIGR01459 family HAD-type hydrolase [Methylocystis sp.]|nr:TIGR01459 family HAD-type hydrolase [Methylocystis sp.]
MSRRYEINTQISPQIAGLAELAERYDAILCDVWGVLIDGRRHFPEAAAALRAFRARGGVVALITNASRPSEEVLRQLRGLGLPDDAHDAIVSAGELTLQEIVARGDQACFHLGPHRDDALFEAAARRLGRAVRRVSPEAADFVVCTGLVDDEAETPQDYDERLAALRERGLVMLCANPDVVVGVGDRLYWCAGALARRYAALGGEVKIFGKPETPIYDSALAQLAEARGAPLERARVLAIGDGAETDLLGAARAHIDCLFVTGGVHRDELLKPDGALDCAALRALFARVGADPAALAPRIVW